MCLCSLRISSKQEKNTLPTGRVSAFCPHESLDENFAIITNMPFDDNQADTKYVSSVEEIRSHFPALKRVHNGHPVAYFDGPGGTQVPTSVVEAMNDYLFNHNANTHWEYPSSNETDEIIDDSRATIADFLNAEPSEVAFGQNMTTLIYLTV